MKLPAAAPLLELPAACHKPLLQASKDPGSQRGDFEPNLTLIALAFCRVNLMPSGQLLSPEKSTLQFSVLPKGCLKAAGIDQAFHYLQPAWKKNQICTERATKEILEREESLPYSESERPSSFYACCRSPAPP